MTITKAQPTEPQAAHDAATAIAEIVANPRMPAARRIYLQRFLELYGDEPFLVRLLLESGRFFVHLMTVLLHVNQDIERRETWCTVGLLKQTMAGFGIASERQMDHLIARLRTVGFITIEPAPGDRRVRLLIPTEAMMQHDRHWLAVHYAPLTVLWPEKDYGHVMQCDPEFQRLHRREAMKYLLPGMRVMTSVPETMLFFNRIGGQMVRSALLWAAIEQDDASTVAVPYIELAERFGISRTQVRQILVAAEQAGLVKLIGRGGRQVELTPKLWSSYDEGIAGGMYLHDIVYRATELRLSRE